MRIWRTRPARLSPYASGPKPGRRLDQALGHLAEPIDPIRATEIAEACCAFDEPIGAAKTIATAPSWNAGSACRLRFEVSYAASVQIALPGQLRRQPMQQNVKALGGFRTGVPQCDASLSSETAGGLDSASFCECLETRDQDVGEMPCFTV